LVLLALSALSSFMMLPEEVRYFSNSETADGTIAEWIRTVCDDASCYGNAEVRFQTSSGQWISEVFVVDLDAKPGDVIPVTYLLDDPLEARHFGPSTENLIGAVVFGPLLAVGVVGYSIWFFRKHLR